MQADIQIQVYNRILSLRVKVSFLNAHYFPGSDGERAEAMDRRCRSTSTGTTRRRKKMSTKNKVVSTDKTNFLVETNMIYGPDGEVDVEKTKGLAVLKSLPPSLARAVRARNGAIHGVWIVPSPLQILPNSYWTTFFSIAENFNLPENKILEWKMDLLREYDEKRFDRMESFTLSKRNEIAELISKTEMRKSSAKEQSGMASVPRNLKSGDYYKDRGRQPYKM